MFKTYQEERIKENKTRIEAFEEAIEIIKQYSNKDCMIAALEGKIQGCEIVVEVLTNGKRVIL